MNFSKLDKLKEDKKVTFDDLAEITGKTAGGLKKIWKNRKVSLEVLESIAKHFDVPVGYFFDETGVPNSITQKGDDNIFYYIDEVKGKQVSAEESGKLLYRIKSLEMELDNVKTERDLLKQQIDRLDKIIEKLTK